MVADEQALELLMAEYRDKVLRLAWSITGSRELAEDCAQEVFVRVWRALSGFRGDSSVSTWIFAITRNVALTALKNNAPKPLPLSDPQPIHSPHAPDIPLLLLRLSEKYRQVITLFYMEERSYEECARELDLPLGTVKTYLYRARKELAEALQSSKLEKGVRQ